MTKNIFSFFHFLILSFVCASGANAETLLTNFYIGGTAGVGFAYANEHYLNSQSVGGIVGLQIPFSRIEVEYNHIGAKRDEYNARANTAFANAYLRATAVPVFHPYIGGGAGYVHAYGDDKIGYQGMIGTEIDIPFLPFAIDAEARYMWSKLMQHADFRLKARIQF